MQDMIEKLKAVPHIKTIGFVVALVLILLALKFGIEGITD